MIFARYAVIHYHLARSIVQMIALFWHDKSSIFVSRKMNQVR